MTMNHDQQHICLARIAIVDYSRVDLVYSRSSLPSHSGM